MRFLVAGAIAVATLCLAGAASAQTATTYQTFEFVGVCSDCTALDVDRASGATPQASAAPTGTAELVLQDYTPGQAITTDNFVSFSYDSSLLTYNLTTLSGLGGDISGLIGALPGPYNFMVEGTGTGGLKSDGSISNSYTALFTSSGDGSWCTNDAGTCSPTRSLDQGVGGIYTLASDTSISAAPEPYTWALMLGGVAVMGLALRRRRTVALATT